MADNNTISMLIDVLLPLPPGVNQSYGIIKYARYGSLQWQYNGYGGEVEAICSQKFRSDSKYTTVTGVKIWMAPGVQATYTPTGIIFNFIPDFYINGVATNIITGKGMPITPP